jgi:MYXO-CTERM domain-containing protein
VRTDADQDLIVSVLFKLPALMLSMFTSRRRPGAVARSERHKTLLVAVDPRRIRQGSRASSPVLSRAGGPQHIRLTFNEPVPCGAPAPAECACRSPDASRRPPRKNAAAAGLISALLLREDLETRKRAR